MRSERLVALCFPIVILALIVISCSKSTEVVTRQDQERMFGELFGFAPPKAVVEISYKDVYNRQPMNGAWGRWMRFTYTDDVFSRILKDHGYKPRDASHFLAIESNAAPAWWPKVDQTRITIYLRSDKDTPQSEGYRFEEYLWRDTNSNVVYYHKRYWD